MERKNFSFGQITNNNHFLKIGNIELHRRNIVLKDFFGMYDSMYYWSEDDNNIILHDGNYSKLLKLEKVDSPHTELYIGSENDSSNFFCYLNKNVKKNIKLLVSSHKNYIDKTEIELEMNSLGFDDSNSVYVISGSSNEEQNGNRYNTKTNHWEYSALLRASKVADEDAPDYWYLTHDTAIPGITFKDKMESFDFTLPFDLVCSNEICQFNIGYYKHSFLKEIAMYLEEISGMSKYQGIVKELNSELRRRAELSASDINNIVDTGRVLTTYGKVPRTERYIKSTDLYKYYFSLSTNHPQSA